MRIAYLGNFQPHLPSGLTPWSTEHDVAVSLEELGHEVLRWQENETTAEEALDRARQDAPDLMLWTKTADWLRGDAHRLIAEAPCPTALFHLDLWSGLSRAREVAESAAFRCRYVFTADGGSADFWREHRVNHFWSPPAVLASSCYTADSVPAMEIDVLFVGSYGYHREWPYRQELIDWLRRQYGTRFRLVEHGSEGAPWRGHKLNQLYSSARVIVGDSCCLGFDHRRYWSDRAPETIGRGGFLVHPRIDGMGEHYHDREHIVYYDFGDWSGLRWTIDWYLHQDHEAERRRIARDGQAHVVAHHTYTHRMRTVLETIGKAEGW